MNYNINGYNELKEYLADIIDNKEIDNRELLKVVISSIAIKNSVNNDDCNVTGEQQENTVCPFIYEF